MSRVETVQAIYAAFGRGDVDAIVGAFAPDGVLAFNVAHPSAPWHGPYKGRAEVPGFFAALGQHVEFEAFEPNRFIADGEAVIVRVRLRYKVKATNRIVDQVQIHWWEFSGAQIRSMIHFEDTAAVAAAVAR